jgi:hypothetical protein
MRSTYVIKIPGCFKPAIADLTPPYPEGCDHWHVNRINVPVTERGKGIGHSMLKWILKDADTEGVQLCLHPQPSDGLTFDELVSWYERHGFVDDESNPCRFIRTAQVTEQV